MATLLLFIKWSEPPPFYPFYLAVLVLASSYLAAAWLGDTKAELNILATHAIDVAKRLFGTPDFRYYALADGIKAIFSALPYESSNKKTKISELFLIS